LFSFSPAATPNAKRQTPITANWQLVTPAQENHKKIKQNTHKTPQKLSLKNKYEQQKKK